MMILFRTGRLYRWLGAAALMVTLVPGPMAAQSRTGKAKGPRAIGVVRWQMGPEGKAVPRLLPVVVLDEGKYYDASLYRATPRPMALEPGVVYEAQDKGESLGFFTVKNAARSETTKQWFGLGDWENVTGVNELELRDRPQSAELVKEAEKKTSEIFTEPVDDRDIKKKTTVYDEQGRPVPEGQPVPPDDKDKPSMKRKQGDIDRLPQVAPPKKEPPKTTKDEDDPDRPKLKRGTPGQPTNQKTPEPAKTSTAPAMPAKKSEDPDRPVLKRGGGGQQKVGDSSQAAGMSVPARVQARGDVNSGAVRGASGLATRTFEAVAISDAEDTERRPDFGYRWRPDEKEEVAAKLRRVAEIEVANFATSAGLVAPRNGKTSAGLGLELVERTLAGLDLDLNNSAELVYSATSQAAGKTLFVTIVARLNQQGEPRRLAAFVTASDRLDVLPRMELVDAVDANGDGRGELLFRRLRDHGAEFVLYRVGADSLTELFHGGNAE